MSCHIQSFHSTWLCNIFTFICCQTEMFSLSSLQQFEVLSNWPFNGLHSMKWPFSLFLFSASNSMVYYERITIQVWLNEKEKNKRMFSKTHHLKRIERKNNTTTWMENKQTIWMKSNSDEFIWNNSLMWNIWYCLQICWERCCWNQNQLTWLTWCSFNKQKWWREFDDDALSVSLEMLLQKMHRFNDCIGVNWDHHNELETMVYPEIWRETMFVCSKNPNDPMILEVTKWWNINPHDIRNQMKTSTWFITWFLWKWNHWTIKRRKQTKYSPSISHDELRTNAFSCFNCLMIVSVKHQQKVQDEYQIIWIEWQ